MRWLCIPLLMVVPAAGQEPHRITQPQFLLSRADGEQWPVTLLETRGSGETLSLKVQRLGQTRWVGVADVLALHGPVPNVQSKVAVYLVGGAELKGRLIGGGPRDETVLVATPALGTVQVEVDRLACIVFRARAPVAGPAAFQLPRDAKEDEAVFKTARRGFDTVLGEVERFTAAGILFQPVQAKAPQLFRYRELAGFALRGGDGPKRLGQVQLITTAGDLLRVELLAVADGKLRMRTESGESSLALAKVAALTFLAGRGGRYLSELPVQREDERASADDLGTRPLFRHRRDRTASGGFVGAKRHPADGFLTVHGRTYGKGLGVHSRSKLTFRVPKECTRFHALVGIDDEVLALGVRGNADVRVTMHNKVLFKAEGLQRGQPPRSLGILAVEPGALLTLEVDFGKGMFLGDRVDWLSPVFLR